MLRYQNIQVFVFFTMPWFTKFVASWWVLVYDTGLHFWIFFYLGKVNVGKTLILLMWNWMGLFLKKYDLWTCWDCLSLLVWIGVVIASIAKNAYKKIGAFINSMKFLSSEVAFCVYKSTIRSCMENFMSGLVLEYVGWVSTTAGPSLASSPKALTYYQTGMKMGLMATCRSFIHFAIFWKHHNSYSCCARNIFNFIAPLTTWNHQNSYNT